LSAGAHSLTVKDTTDWVAQGKPQNYPAEFCYCVITSGQQVDVTPLLNRLEQNLRSNVVAAANYANKAAGFGSPTETSELPNWSESGVNAVFGIGPRPSPVPKFDCIAMANLIMVRGVIASLNPGEYKAMGFCAVDLGIDRFGNAGSYFTVYNPAVRRAALKPGDWVAFWNNPNYRAFHSKGDWKTENVITTGSDSYWGWNSTNGATETYDGWKTTLLDAFNSGVNNLQQINIAGVPGYDQGNAPDVTAGFVNVPKLAMDIFNYRTRQGRFAEGNP
jgi:hypothetical protein